MSNTATHPVIRASVADIAKLAEFLSALFDAPVMITAADVAVPAPAERHLVMIVAEVPAPAERHLVMIVAETAG
ncbi:hypothetical protein ABQE62_05635 [Mycolicibacterium fortuitum]